LICGAEIVISVSIKSKQFDLRLVFPKYESVRPVRSINSSRSPERDNSIETVLTTVALPFRSSGLLGFAKLSRLEVLFFLITLNQPLIGHKEHARAVFVTDAVN
jgi:hypothetical protein